MNPKLPIGSIQTTNLASSREGNLPLGTSYLESQEQIFLQKRIGITFMYHMLVHGVRPRPSVRQATELVC
jgi:hypothetical protein